MVCIVGEAYRLRGSRWKHCQMGAGLQCETLRNTSQTWIYRWWDCASFTKMYICLIFCLVQHHVLMIHSRGPLSSTPHTRLSRGTEWPGTQWLSAPHPHTLHLPAEWVCSSFYILAYQFSLCWMCASIACLCTQSQCVQWDMACLLYAAPPRDNSGSSVATV